MLRVAVLLFLTTLAFSAREPKQITLPGQGTLTGMYMTRFRTKRIAAYVGIPYAQPPVDSRRFLPPDYIDLPQWNGVRNATEYAPDCMQSDSKKDDVQNAIKKHDELFMKLLDTQLEEPRQKNYSEDCLYLNVYVPDGFSTELGTHLHINTFVGGADNHTILSLDTLNLAINFHIYVFGGIFLYFKFILILFYTMYFIYYLTKLFNRLPKSSNGYYELL